ncbi:hypothetical protein OB03_00990 [Brevundimonas sp. GN22]
MLFWLCTLAYLIAAIAFVVWGDARFKAHKRLPMQWNGALKPTWSLPRRWALLTCAVLAGIGFLAVLPIFGPLMMKGTDVDIAGGLGLFFLVTGIGVNGLYAGLLLRWDRKITTMD